MGLRDELKLDEVDKSNTDFTPLPKGEYELIIEDVTDAFTKDGNGQYYRIQFAVISPEKYEGRKIWENYNIHHINPITQNIGRARFDDLLQASGYADIDYNTELIGARIIARVDIKKGTNGYSDSNKITSVKINKDVEKQEKVLSGGII